MTTHDDDKKHVESKASKENNNLDLDLAATTELVSVPGSGTVSHFTNLSDLAVASKQIAKMKEPRELSLQELNLNKIIHTRMEEKWIVNIYRDARTRLLHLGKGRNFVALITSVVRGGGASHIAINLATSFAFDSTKTSMLVDCDLFKPTLDKLLDLKYEEGLIDYIEDENISISQIIYPTGIHRLRLIPVGKRRESSTEYFTSVRMKILINSLKRRYPDRFIFIDSPSIGDSADTRILADLCDYIVLVVPYGQVSDAKLEQVLESIDQSKIAGVIFNK